MQDAVAVKRKGTVATSAAVRAVVESRRTMRRPLLLSGVEPGKRLVIKPADFKRVDVDRRYQRDKITDSINDLIFVLQNGGEIPDPIAVVRRTYDNSDKLWIIDGQQRFMAHLEVNREIQAIQHDVSSFDAERQFFLVMNTRHAMSANVVVQSWAGASADLVRAAARTQGHPLFCRVIFVGSGNDKVGAAILAKGMLAALTANVHGGKIDQILTRTDSALTGPYGARAKLIGAAFLSLAGRVFHVGYAPSLAVSTLGLVCHERWEKTIMLPGEATIERLRHVNWRSEVPSFAERFRVVMEACIKRIWKQ